MNIQDIYQLMNHFEGSAVSELELEMEGVKVSLKKGGRPVLVSEAETIVQPTETSAVKPAAAQAESSGTKVEAPLLGTFYASPSPEEAPFVIVGKEVKKGDVVGIIEAMKLMNEITAPCDGIIESIQVENGQMVEYHQVLMTVK